MKYHEWVVKARNQSVKDKISIPIIPASTYRDRDRKLSASGLLDWERFWLVAHRLDTPGMKEMLAERKAKYQKAKDKKMTVQEYRAEIGDWYKRRGWKFNNNRNNPFDMLMFYRDDDRDPKNRWPYNKQAPRAQKDFVKAKKRTVKKKKVERPSGSLFFRPPVR